MMCPKCGYALPDDSEFCQYCGEKLSLISEAVGNECVPESVETEKPEVLLNKPDVGEDPEKENSETQGVILADAPAVIAEKHVEQKMEMEVEADTIKQVNTDVPTNAETRRYCKKCGGLVDNKSKKCLSCGKQYFRFPVKTVIHTCMVLFIIALVGLNIYQYWNYGKQTETLIASVTDLEQQVKTKDSTIATQKSTITTQKNKIAELEGKADYYDEICSFLSRGNIGYAADNFKSSESIILVRKGETNRKFTLTAYWSNGGTVSTSYSSFLVAGISYDNDNWSRSTTMTINPQSEGISIVTFTNNVDSKTFKIMIIVTD